MSYTSDMIDHETPDITQDEIKRALNYDPLTGAFTWKISPSPHVRAGDSAGTIGLKGYRQIRYKRITRAASRWAVFWMTGKWPSGQVDHINRMRDDDRWCNLRCVTHEQNSWNTQSKISNKLGKKGIHYNANIGRYCADIRVRGKNKSLGCFKTIDEAIAARNAAVMILQGEFGLLTN